jgi:hypothetical protein
MGSLEQRTKKKEKKKTTKKSAAQTHLCTGHTFSCPVYQSRGLPCGAELYRPKLLNRSNEQRQNRNNQRLGEGLQAHQVYSARRFEGKKPLWAAVSFSFLLFFFRLRRGLGERRKMLNWIFGQTPEPEILPKLEELRTHRRLWEQDVGVEARDYLKQVQLSWDVEAFRFVLDLLQRNKDQRLCNDLTHPFNHYRDDPFNVLTFESFRNVPPEKWNKECIQLLISHPAAGDNYFSPSEFFYGKMEFLGSCDIDFVERYVDFLRLFWENPSYSQVSRVEWMFRMSFEMPHDYLTKVLEPLLGNDSVARLYGGYDPKHSKHLYGLQRYVELGNDPSGALAVAESYSAAELLLELGGDPKEVIENEKGGFPNPKTLHMIAQLRKQQVKMYLTPSVAKKRFYTNIVAYFKIFLFVHGDAQGSEMLRKILIEDMNIFPTEERVLDPESLSYGLPAPPRRLWHGRWVEEGEQSDSDYGQLAHRDEFITAGFSLGIIRELPEYVVYIRGMYWTRWTHLHFPQKTHEMVFTILLVLHRIAPEIPRDLRNLVLDHCMVQATIGLPVD